MTRKELPKGYEPADVESRWLDHWKTHETFKADPEADGQAYSIVIPPPNVTGALHMGHALNITLQDIMCRHRRQKGDKVLWVPGTDHAGIATQNVVEKALAKDGKGRKDLGREAFIERVWQWKDEYGNKILNQISRLGASVDWSRLRFTMDEGLSRAVREVFVRLYDEGLIYRGNYIVNWCGRCHTSLADIEVEYHNATGTLHYINYPLADGSGVLTVATTRPETMLGDTAVAVHPEDERYAAFVGKDVLLPLTDRRIPVIADAYVEKEFGTGCLKVTPAHDMNDYELGRKHSLPVLQVIDGDGNMTAEAGAKYQGLSMTACRKAVVAELRELGLLIREEPLEHNVGHCYRCRTVVEPHVSKQWFVAVKPLAEAARKAVEDGQTAIFPAQWTKTYFEWLDNIRDWCVSRQIWWGHRIPAWTCESCGQLIVAKSDPDVCPHCGSARLTQDEDVLDTWFSSALWPFSTLGWPDRTRDLEVFYPTSVLVTGFDILFFWVARMMMMGIHFMDKVPFDHVYIHALVRDAEGKKMSKSTGNVIDPLVMIDKYGTDSLRMTLTAFAAMGRDIKLSEERIEGYRHFVNKLWNAARFAMMNLPQESDSRPSGDLHQASSLGHKWILHRLEEVKVSISDAIAGYRFNEAAQGVYQFVWHEFCDWYLEMIKPEFYGEDATAKANAQACLWTVLSELLVLAHPIIPFVTQEIWSSLPGAEPADIATAMFPPERPECRNPRALSEMALLQDVVVSVRNIRAELGINPGERLDVLVRVSTDEERSFVAEIEGYVRTLAKVGTLCAIGADEPAPKGAAGAVAGGHEIFVPLAGHVDVDAETARLDKELVKLAKEIGNVERKLANEGFMAKAPEDVVAKERAKAAEMSAKRDKLNALKERLAGLK